MHIISKEVLSAIHPLDRVLRKTAIAAVAGAGMLLAATQSHAVTVYSGPVNLSIPATTNGLYLNVVTGANNLPSSTGGSTVPGWDVNVWSTTGLGFFNPTAPSGGAYVVSSGTTVANLAAGASIGPASTFSSGTSANTAQWTLNSSDNLFGFRFLNEANGLVHYGWARISLSSPISGTRSLVEYAFESEAGVGILAGVTGVVPEPATYGLMAAGVAGLLLLRRRKA